MSNETSMTREIPATMAIHDAAKAQAAALAKAQVQTRYELALMRPRVLDRVRSDLLAQCAVPGFARAARYSLPIGKGKVSGWSIRFVEAAVNLLGNIDVQITTAYDDDIKRLINVSVVDLERNTSYSAQAVIEKTVERRKAPEEGSVIAIRTGSEGQRLFIIAASERDMMMKTNAAASRIVRTQGLRHIPPWILEECETAVAKAARSSLDPNAERKALVDGFAKVGVSADQLAAYLEHDLSGASDDELLELRAIYTAIRDGDAKWKDYVALSSTPAGEDDPHAKTREALAAKKAALSAKAKGKTPPKSEPAKGKPKASKPAPKEEAPPPVNSGEVVDETTGEVHLTAEEVAQGWEIDPLSGEKVPPAGGEG